MEQTLSRRQLLGGTAAALASGTGGCLSTLPPLGQRIRYGRINVPSSGPPTYRRWVPADSARPDADTAAPDEVMYGHPGPTGREDLGRSIRFTQPFHVGWSDYVGIEYTTYDEALLNGAGFVGETTVDRDDVASTLAQTGYERTDTYDGYTLYTRSDIPRALAVGDAAVVQASSDTVADARAHVEATVDAEAGRAERRHQADPAFKRLSDLTGARPFTWLGASGIELGDPVIGASSATFDDDAIYYVWDELYASADATPSRSEVKQWLEDQQRPQSAMLTDIETDGAALTVEMRLPGEEFEARTNNEPSPYVTWGVDHDAEAGRLTFRHEAGDAVDIEALTLRPEGGYRGSPPFEGSGSFGPGDGVTVELTDDPANRYQIVWGPTDGGTSTLVQYDLGGNE